MKWSFQIWIILALYAAVNAGVYHLQMPIYFYPLSAVLVVLLIGLCQKEPTPNIVSKDEIKKAAPLTEIIPKKRFQKELDMAKRVQTGLLTVESPTISGVRIAKKCQPAESVGGDFYSFIHKDFVSLSPQTRKPGIIEYIDQEDTHLGISIGDVAGHGVSSALIMALTAGLLNEIAKQHKQPSKVLERVNTDLIRYIQNSQITHVTAFFAVLNTSSNELSYACAGHTPAIVVRQDQSTELLEARGVFLGMFDGEEYEEKKITLRPGDRVYFYTDGIPETKAPTGEQFGDDRFKNLLIHNQNRPIEQVIDMIFGEIDTFANHQNAADDRTLVILEIV